MNFASAKFEEAYACLNNVADAPDRIWEVQPLLADGLHLLSSLRVKANHEKNALVQRKDGLNSSWFLDRMRKLGDYSTKLEHAAGPGLSVGDAMAWFFYGRSPELLQQHLRLRATSGYPTGVGGAAERDLTRTHQRVAGHFLLAHNTTSMLRHGDFSLVDTAEQRVVGLCELKAGKPDGDSMPCELAIITSQVPRGWSTEPTEAHVHRLNLPATMAARRGRQLKKAGELLSEGKPVEPEFSAEMGLANNRDALLDCIRSAATRGSALVAAGPSLLYAAFRLPGRTPFTRMSSATPAIPELFPDLADRVRHELDLHHPLQTLHIATLHYTDKDGNRPYIVEGMPPLHWWLMDKEAVANVLFRRVHVMAIWSSARLLRLLESSGYVLKQHGPDLLSVGVTRKEGRHTFGIKRIADFYEQIYLAGTSEEGLLDVFDQTLRSVASSGETINGRINLIWKHPILGTD